MQIKFDTKVQYIKYKVLSEVARHAYKGDLNENLLDTEDAELLSNPNSWYEANNINNNFVISEIDADFLDVGITIARTSRKN